jgi:hypothetical protein
MSTAYLSPKHRRQLEEGSAIAPEIVAERGYYTARRGVNVPRDRGTLPEKPGLILPTYSPDGVTRSYQLSPNRKGKGPKYWSPRGQSPIVDVHPRMLEEVRYGNGPLLLTEGVKTGDSATSRGIPTAVLAGVWMWCVPGVKPYRLKPCFDHIRLAGRPVFVAFDSDCMTKESVQQALATFVEALQGRGAVVKVIYLPDAQDGSKQGVDDFLAAGGTVKELFMLAREFKPADIGEIRMSRDEKHRATIEYLWKRWRECDWMRFVGSAERGNWQRGHTARDTKEALIKLATRQGKLDDRGIVVAAGLRTLAEMSAKSATSVGDAVKHLEADGQIEILAPEDKSKPRSYRLLVPRAALYSMEGEATEKGLSEESSPRCKGLRAPSAPRLRWSSPGRPRRREFELVPGRYVVRHSGRVPRDPTPEDLEATPYVKRLGPPRGAVLDTLEAAGGELHLLDLCETLCRKRPRDVRRRILKPLEEAGIIEFEGDVVRLAYAWLAKLEEERERTGEIEQAERQAKKHREQSARYREHLGREKRGTPKASLDAVRRTEDLRERRLQEEIHDEGERDRAPTPPAVEALVARILGQHDRIRMGLLCAIAREDGLRWRDVPPAVRRRGYRVERLAEFGNAEFVFAPRARGEEGAA